MTKLILTKFFLQDFVRVCKAFVLFLRYILLVANIYIVRYFILRSKFYFFSKRKLAKHFFYFFDTFYISNITTYNLHLPKNYWLKIWMNEIWLFAKSYKSMARGLMLFYSNERSWLIACVLFSLTENIHKKRLIGYLHNLLFFCNRNWMGRKKLFSHQYKFLIDYK